MYKYLLYFLIFSFLGWCIEVIFYAVRCGHFVNRGLARGPVCPIYGIGIGISAALLRSVKSFLLLSLLAMSVATIVELVVGIVTHKMLGTRLWNYTEEKGNILGYVCPRFSLIWGIACALVIKLLPFLDRALVLLYNPICYALSVIMFVIIIVDAKSVMVSTKSNANG